jgi:hypothetical protein
VRITRPIKPVPPDHPMFHSGVSFVFRHDLPEDELEHEQDDDVVDGDEHDTPNA